MIIMSAQLYIVRIDIVPRLFPRLYPSKTSYFVLEMSFLPVSAFSRTAVHCNYNFDF